MKRTFAIFITFCYLSGVFAPFYTYAGYFLNKDFIIENFCINKNKPELECDGKCYLNKQIAEQTQKTADAQTPVNENMKSLTAHEIVSDNQITFFPSKLLLKQSLPLKTASCNGVPAVYSPPEILA